MSPFKNTGDIIDSCILQKEENLIQIIANNDQQRRNKYFFKHIKQPHS
jgi:hypothetical protein